MSKVGWELCTFTEPVGLFNAIFAVATSYTSVFKNWCHEWSMVTKNIFGRELSTANLSDGFVAYGDLKGSSLTVLIFNIRHKT